MNTSDLGYFALGAGFVLAIKLITAWADYKVAVAQERERMETPNPNLEVGLHFLERDARRVERPLEERSVPGFVVRDVDIDRAHKIVNAKPGSITFLDGARAE
jgi:hypothetical protein